MTKVKVAPPAATWGFLRSLLTIAPILIGAVLLALKHHFTLPQPLTDLTNPLTNLPQISESRILAHAKYLSEDIGYRTVGTREHALADAWMLNQVEEFRRLCNEMVAGDGGQRKLECEVWRQQGSGSHRFDMMSKRLYKTYVNLTNIVVRVSNGTPEGKEHAVLVNSHLDSTLPSPGAADDAIAVGIMLECMRVLVQTPGWSPNHAIVFLFNNAEESLQDGSHMYSTQHPTASTVRAVINLEAAGTTGRELLFQATSEQMIQAYSHVPRPYGTILANDIFSSGVLLSDTDFRQFEQYLNVTGLDIAVVGNSYLYHMRKDLVENIQPGVAQHMGENALALLQHLSGTESPLPSLTQGYSRPTTVYASHTGLFIVYSFAAAKIMHIVLLFSSVLYLQHFGPAEVTEGGWMEGFPPLLAGIGGALVVPNVVAFVMANVLDKGMSWFTSEISTLVLYGPPALLGALGAQLLVKPVNDYSVLAAILVTHAFCAFAIQSMGVGSAIIFFLSALPLFLSLVLNGFLAKGATVSLWTYSLGQLLPLLTGVQLMMPTLDVFVPLTGRLGAHVPADNVIATLVMVMGSTCLPLVIPFMHRFGRQTLVRAVQLLTAATVVSMAVFAIRAPFDDMHQKRMFVLHLENITSQEHHLHIAAADPAPGFDTFAARIAQDFAAPGHSLTREIMDDTNTDWDPLYPFSAFLTPYKVDLPSPAGYVSPWSTQRPFTVRATKDVRDVLAGTRALTLEITHPGIIWTVVAFDAHVIQWTLDDNPPDEYARHHIKEASFYGIDKWTVDLVLKTTAADDAGLKIDFIGLQEEGMWPAKRNVKDFGPAMNLFEALDFWIDRETNGTVDAMLLGCVAGVVVV
ncbi:hypothetical protein HGRIS_005299 [Hohenbuehelia grisea]|uniref:Peptide hydrolase n=1 Tax=Hohenbuehelia grisea TaxID=104357 RepID=A0ABR3JFC5_9AGAR